MNKIFDELLPIIVIDEQAETHVYAHFSLTKEFIGFQGHFPEQPVMPGICMFELIRSMLYKQNKTLYKLKKVGNSKFFAPIVNDEHITIDAKLTEKKDGTLHVKATLKKDDEQKAVLSLFFLEDK